MVRNAALIKCWMLAGVVSLGVTAETAAVMPKAGKWMVRSNLESSMVMPLAAPKNEEACLKDADFTNGKLPVHANPNCKLLGAKIDDGQIKLDLKCVAPEIADGSGTLSILSPDRLSGKIVVHFHKTTDGQVPEFVYTIEATRQGDCSAGAAQ